MAGVDASLSSAREPDAIPITPPETEAIWRGILLGTDKRYRENYTFLSRLPGDAVHAAVMKRYDIEQILTFDSGFDGLAGIRRIGLAPG